MCIYTYICMCVCVCMYVCMCMHQWCSHQFPEAVNVHSGDIYLSRAKSQGAGGITLAATSPNEAVGWDVVSHDTWRSLPCHTLSYLRVQTSLPASSTSKSRKTVTLPSFRGSWSKRGSENNPGLKPALNNKSGGSPSLSLSPSLARSLTWAFTVYVCYLVWNGTETG